MKNVSQTEERLYANVRAAFISRGTSLAMWCSENNINRFSARNALLFKWHGPKSKALRETIAAAAGIQFNESGQLQK